MNKLLLVENLPDEHRYRAPPVGFECGERVDESGDVGLVTFYCSRPPSCRAADAAQVNSKFLTFSCRKRSVGVLIEDETQVRDEDMEQAYETVDPNFFDAGYTLAGTTGFQIWAGTRLLVESLAWPTGQDPPLLAQFQEKLASEQEKPLKILELGAGIGVVGASLAAAGAEVLLTDLPTLIENATYSNLILNRSRDGDIIDNADEGNADDASSSTTFHRYSDAPSWLGDAEGFTGIPIGNGWAGTAALDWRIAISKQLTPLQYQSLDYIVASDCVWLVSMLDSLLDTADALMTRSNKSASPPLIMSFQRRDTKEGDTSLNFTTVARVVQSIEGRGWTIDCLSWRPTKLEPEETADSNMKTPPVDDKEVFVFSIRKP